MGDNSNCILCEKDLRIKGVKSCCCDFCEKLVCILCLNISTKLCNAMNKATVNTSALLVACQKCNKKAFRTIKKEIEGSDRQEENNKLIKDMVQRFDALSTKVENNIKKLDNIESLNNIIKQAPEKIKETFAEMANRNVPPKK